GASMSRHKSPRVGNSVARGFASPHAFLATQFLSCFLSWGCGCRLGVGCQLMVSKCVGRYLTHLLTPLPFLLLRAPLGGPINKPQKSSPAALASARLTQRFSRFLSRNCSGISLDFCVFAKTDY